jgi:DNA polymerase-3 subunit epsilon
MEIVMQNNDRDWAINWARETMKKNLVIFDTETTGLSPENGDEAVSLGLVSKDGKVLLDTLLRHSRPSSHKALEVHGHTWEETRKAPRLVEVLKHFKQMIDGKDILCYCVNNFDAEILISTCRAHCMPTIDLRRRTIQALEPFAQFYGEWNDYRQSYKWQSLTTAAAHFGIDTAGAHGAAADCLMTLKVVKAMAASRLSGEDAPGGIAVEIGGEWRIFDETETA